MARKLIIGAAVLALGVATAVALAPSKNAGKVETALVPPARNVHLETTSAVPVSRFNQIVETAPGPAELKREWAAVQAKVGQLGADDQAGLARLYAQARAVIRANENAMSKVLAEAIPELVNDSSLEVSFFTVSAWIRGSEHPADIVQALLNYDPPADPPSTDVHHVEQTAAVRYERLEAYSFRELRTQLGLGNIKLDATAHKNLVDALTPRAAREQSLNLALELFQLLATLKEPTAIQSALAGHSQRDQQIIQSVLSTR